MKIYTAGEIQEMVDVLREIHDLEVDDEGHRMVPPGTFDDLRDFLFEDTEVAEPEPSDPLTEIEEPVERDTP